MTLSPEGGSHQSTVTPSLGTELPELDYWEPCFAQELKWILLESIRQCCDRAKGRSTYLRLSTRPVDQGLMQAALARLGEDALRRQVLSGACRLRDWRDGGAADESAPLVILAAAGTMIPEAMAAADILEREGARVNVLGITSPRRLYDQWQAGRREILDGAGSRGEGFLGELILPHGAQRPDRDRPGRGFPLAGLAGERLRRPRREPGSRPVRADGKPGRPLRAFRDRCSERRRGGLLCAGDLRWGATMTENRRNPLGGSQRGFLLTTEDLLLNGREDQGT